MCVAPSSPLLHVGTGPGPGCAGGCLRPDGEREREMGRESLATVPVG